MRLAATAWTVCALCGVGALARAEEAPAQAPVAVETPAPVAAIAPEERRDPARYRGRENPTTASQALRWIPRVAFFPVYVVTELAVRTPIYAGAEWVDRRHLVPIVDDILHPTPDLFWSPTLSLDLGSITFVGLQARWRNLLRDGHELRASVAFGGVDAWRIKARDRWQLGPHAFAGVRGEYESRWDRAFHGFGPGSGGYRTNYAIARGDAFAFAGVEYRNHFSLQLSEGYRQERTSAGGDPSIDTHFAVRDIPGFGDLRLSIAALDLKLDTRRILEENSGARLLANVTYARDVKDVERQFATAEVDLEGAVEISHPDRVISARLHAADTYRLGSEPVPMTHQPALGGKEHHGFIPGRFRGESAVLAELQYRYPIAYYVDAQWTASAGNVFAERFDGFDVGALTSSLGVGLRTRRTGGSALELTFAFGTSRFDERFEVENFRVYFGTSDGP